MGKLRLKKLTWFISGVLMVVIVGTVFATIKVSFFDCKHGTCIILECVDENEQCLLECGDNCDCCYYDTRAVSFRSHLLDEIKLYGLLSGCGLGIFCGFMLMEFKTKKYEKNLRDKNIDRQ